MNIKEGLHYNVFNKKIEKRKDTVEPFAMRMSLVKALLCTTLMVYTIWLESLPHLP